jgi:hypothetical protein
MPRRTVALLPVWLFAQSARAAAPNVLQRPERGGGAQPLLRQTCLITRNFAQLVQFYREVLRIQPKLEGAEYAEFRTGIGTLAIFSAEAQERYVPGETDPASNKSAILEFEVVDVDAEYARLQPLVAI